MNWRKMAIALALLIAIPGLLAPGGEIAAQSGQDVEPSGPEQVHPEAVEAISRIRSPWCPGLMLEVCPSPQAAELRDTLQAMAARGIESDSMVAWALDLYGEEWRAVPLTEGTGLFAWIVPPLALLLGVAAVILVLRRIRARPVEGGEREDRALSPAEEQRISAALREMEGENW